MYVIGHNVALLDVYFLTGRVNVANKEGKWGYQREDILNREGINVGPITSFQAQHGLFARSAIYQNYHTMLAHIADIIRGDRL